MRIKKTTSTVTTGVDTISNEWVENMFDFSNPAVKNNPGFKELSAGAKAFAALILKATPPGEGQQIAIRKLQESFVHAGTGITLNVL